MLTWNEILQRQHRARYLIRDSIYDEENNFRDRPENLPIFNTISRMQRRLSHTNDFPEEEAQTKPPICWAFEGEHCFPTRCLR